MQHLGPSVTPSNKYSNSSSKILPAPLLPLFLNLFQHLLLHLHLLLIFHHLSDTSAQLRFQGLGAQRALTKAMASMSQRPSPLKFKTASMLFSHLLPHLLPLRLLLLHPHLHLLPFPLPRRLLLLHPLLSLLLLLPLLLLPLLLLPLLLLLLTPMARSPAPPLPTTKRMW